MTRRVSVPAPIYALGAIASVQVGATVARHLFAYVGPAASVLFRLGFGALILLALARPRRPHLRPRQWAAIIPFGLVIAAMNLSFYEAIARIPLGIAVTIEFLGPLGVAIAGSRRGRDFAWAGMAGAGVAMLSAERGTVTPVGVLFALGAAAGWASYILLSQRVGRLVPGPNGLAFALALGAIVLLPIGVASAGARLLDPRNLALGLVVAILSSAVPFSLEFAALRRLTIQLFGILMSLEPAMGAVAGFLFLGQRLTAVQLLAIGLVTVASAGATLSRRPAASTGLVADAQPGADVRPP
ncbi:MAG TPA: EamA family transporter [Candidatus Limnocylindrales bacterium]|nr:EamA family transporter [Candidatus Limnocylindrales bacterium]